MRIKTHHAGIPVVVMTAWSSVELAVEAMQRGAVDFIQKPWDNARVLAVVEKHTNNRRQAQRNERRSPVTFSSGFFQTRWSSATVVSSSAAYAYRLKKSAATITIF